MSRLEQRVERLENNTGKRRMPVVVVEVDETEEEAMVRHFAEHPEDRDASDPLIVQLVDPTETAPAE